MFAHVGKHAFNQGGIMLSVNMQPFLQAGMESALLPQQIKDFKTALSEFSDLKPELDKISLQDVVKYALIKGVAVSLPSNMQ